MENDNPRGKKSDFTTGTEKDGLPVVIVLNRTDDLAGLIEVAREHHAVDCPPGSDCDKFRVAFLNGALPMEKTFLLKETQLSLIFEWHKKH